MSVLTTLGSRTPTRGLVRAATGLWPPAILLDREDSKQARRGAGPDAANLRSEVEAGLLDLDGGAGVFECLLPLLGLFLADVLEQGLGGRVHQGLGFLEAQVVAGLAGSLDDL